MIIGNAGSTPYDWPLFLFLVALAAILLIYLRYPTPDGMVGAARVVTIWAALAGDALFSGIWAWRAGRL